MELFKFIYLSLYSNKLTNKIINLKYIDKSIKGFAGILNLFSKKKYRIGELEFIFDKTFSKRIFFNGNFYLGFYEKEERFLCEKYLKKGDNVVEIGGGFGILSCIIKKKIEDGNLLIIEANYNNISYIKKNLKINKLDADIENIFLSNEIGKTKFYLHDSFLKSSSKLKSKNHVFIENKTLISIFKQYSFSFNTLVIDIEGSEVDLFNENIDLIQKYISKIIIEFHPKILGKSQTNKLILDIKRYYKLIEEVNDVFYFKKI